ncbi:MAG: RHS repeat-associated core domain-containing protein [Chloracidobacterium sp.]|nr:RHS repeat-associated core domain-containing protein [Chloracidobacterium sp.]
MSGYHFLQDHLGSTVAVTSSDGSVNEVNSYDSFGNPSNSSFSTRYQFTGREFDSFSGLQYSRARFYDPQIGRFISEDPIGFAGGDVNLYGYVWNDPLNFIDPFGLDGGPLNYFRDPFSPDNWMGNGLSNTLSDLLGLDDVARWSWDLGDHSQPNDVRAEAAMRLGANVALNIIGGGTVCRYLGKAGKWVRYGDEVPVGPNFRGAPFGNRKGGIGQFPHYHRQGPKYTKGKRKGESMPGQGMGRHRPFESHPSDNWFFDRF